MPIPFFINKKTISLALGTLATLTTFAGSSFWIYENVAWKKDLNKVVTVFQQKDDISLLELLRVRHSLVRSDFELYRNAIRTLENKEELTVGDRANLIIFRENFQDAESEKKQLETRIEFLQKKIDGVR
jgi:hypothetical protein